MKKVLLEYSNVFAYTITGLVFGLSFFLLFINFYHMQELSYEVDISEYNEMNKREIEEKINVIKSNISVYNQSSYKGDLNIYALNAGYSKLESCIEIIESDEMMKYISLNKVGIDDVYNFTINFKNKIINDCLVMQMKSYFNTNTTSTLPNFSIIKPYVELNISNLLTSVDYVQDNIENSDHYYFTTDNNKNNFFNLVDNSYSEVLNNYQDVLDLLVEISNWYKNVVIGG